MDCVFCKIINRQLPSNIIYEDNEVIAFTPLEIVSKGHTLVIPKKHSKDIFDTDYQTMAQISKALKDLSQQIATQNNATGVNILNANGIDAQQSVFHIHFHIVPRYPNDGLDMWIKQKL